MRQSLKFKTLFFLFIISLQFVYAQENKALNLTQPTSPTERKEDPKAFVKRNLNKAIKDAKELKKKLKTEKGRKELQVKAQEDLLKEYEKIKDYNEGKNNKNVKHILEATEQFVVREVKDNNATVRFKTLDEVKKEAEKRYKDYVKKEKDRKQRIANGEEWDKVSSEENRKRILSRYGEKSKTDKVLATIGENKTTVSLIGILFILLLGYLGWKKVKGHV